MRHTNRAPQSGFTLVEVLLTITIMAMMLVAISEMLTATRTTRDSIQNMQETQLAGPAILDMIERDLRGLLTFNLPLTSQLQLTDRVLLGQDADSLNFITTSDNVHWTSEADRLVRADWSEVGYCLRPNPENDEFLELYRREDFGVDDSPFEGGTYTFLHDRVKGLDIRAFAEDGEDSDLLEEWNQNPTDAETQGLPARLEILLVLELTPRLIREQMVIGSKEQRTVEYRRIWRLPESLRLAIAETPRPGIPAEGGGEQAEQEGQAGSGEPEGEGQPTGEEEPPEDEGDPSGDGGGR